MPMIPIIPGSAGGAGIGSLTKAKTNPTINPANNAKIISCISFTLLIRFFHKRRLSISLKQFVLFYPIRKTFVQLFEVASVDVESMLRRTLWFDATFMRFDATSLLLNVVLYLSREKIPYQSSQ